MMARFLRRPDAFLRHFCAILQHPRQKSTCSIGAKNALRTKGLFAAPAPAVAGTGFPRSHGPPERKVNGSRLTLRYCSRCPSHDRKRRPFDPCRPEQDDMGRTPNKPKSRRNAGESEIMMPKGTQRTDLAADLDTCSPDPWPQRNRLRHAIRYHRKVGPIAA
jgi:hypothetical protein